ncbi:group 1 truncated hemoglobin [Planctomycetaceae bacterium]|nr:group 1 truncated hemoglobin [Planctomycetaceae bacterium]MDC0307958.1 group 1 truncated hemoglobin [Planctomycetaceae bacterium]
MNAEKSLYERLGGYDAISAVVNNLIPRLVADEQLGRFWAHRGNDGLEREKQLLIDFLAHSSGGPMYYTGRDMKLTHSGMRISDSDWDRFIQHLQTTLATVELPESESDDVISFIQSTKNEIVEA